MHRRAISLSIGDRDLPLEGDLETDFSSGHPLVGERVKVSPIAGGELLPLREETVEITSALVRLGQLVGLSVRFEGKSYRGSLKDFFVDRKVLEDIQPPSPYSKSIREGLSHWKEQRTYWGSRIDGLESFCFELSSATPSAKISISPWGWSFHIPDAMPGKATIVDCRAVKTGNFWTMTTAVVPTTESTLIAEKIRNPWERVFSWTSEISKGMIEHGFPWQASLKNLLLRKQVSQKILQPMIDKTLPKVLETKKKLLGEVEDPGLVWGAFSEVRLKPTFVGLTEPPTDRRPYTIVSLTPQCCKSMGYLEQVVLHECIHIAVGSRGGEPHNKEFHLLSKKLGLKPEHRD